MIKLKNYLICGGYGGPQVFDLFLGLIIQLLGYTILTHIHMTKWIYGGFSDVWI